MTHDDFHNLTQAYLAGGLADDERAAMDAHAAECPACAASLEQAQAADRELQDAFAADMPDDRLEDRVIAAIRKSRGPRRVVHPIVRRAAVGVAAAILLGGVGFAVTRESQAPLSINQQEHARANDGRDPTVLYDDVGAGVAATQPGITRWAKGGDGNGRRLPALRLEGEEPALAKKLAEPQSKNQHYWWDSGQDFDYRVTPTDQFDSIMMPDDDTSGASNGEGTKRFFQLGIDVTPKSGTKTGESLGDAEASNKPVDRFKPADSSVRGTSSSAVAGKEIESLSLNAKRPELSKLDSKSVDKASNLGRLQTLSEGIAVTNGTLDISGEVRNKQWGEPGSGQGQLQGQQQQELSRSIAGTVISGDAVDKLARGRNEKPADQPAAGTSATRAPANTESVNFSLTTDGPAKKSSGGGSSTSLFSAAVGQPAESTPTPAAQPAAPKADPPKAEENALAGRKIIRNGEMTFEVDGYDSAVVQINKIAGEEGGFVATTESEKLPNGKVKGSVIVRVPPDRLDTLVLKLRGLGDLKNSRVSAQDVTKQYTDLDAQLRAAKTMEQRLLELIKSGKGEVKDLIEAEKQLGSWREKIEKLEGEIRYYNNLVSLSTLTVTLAERDVRAASLLSETEQVQMGVEADDVEKARAAALKAIEEAKGRVISSDLKKHAAGQFAATITADIAPDQAGPAIDRLKQLGRVARLEAQRQQRTAEGAGTPIPGARIERKDTRLTLSIYNLANVAARNTTTMQLAAEDVEAAYRAILGQVESAGGRVVNSQLSKPTPEQTTGTITFESPTAAADVLMGAVRGAGDVLRLDTAINPDADNTTSAKRGFNVTIQSAATVAPAESVSLRLAVDDVSVKFEKLVGALRGVNGARITQSSVNQQTPTNTVGQIEVDVRGAEPRAAVERALAEAGAVYLRSVSHASPGQTMLADKAHVSVLLGDVDAIPPRETTTVNLETADVTSAAGAIEAAAVAAGGRKVDSDWSQQPGGQTVAKIVVDVPQSKAADLIKQATDGRRVLSIQREQTPNVPEGPFARSRLSVSFSTTDTIQGDQTLGGSVRSGLATSVQWLLRSVTWIVVGLCLIAPWALVIWAISRVMKRRKRATTPDSPTPPSAAPAT